MKLLKLILICNILFFISACSCKQTDIYNGINEHSIKYNIDIKYNVIKDKIIIDIINNNNLKYKAWLTYEYVGKFKNGTISELIYEGNGVNKMFFITKPHYIDITYSVYITITNEKNDKLFRTKKVYSINNNMH
jgi:hypothetical protein